MMSFHFGNFSDNFKELATYTADSRIYCASLCTVETGYHVCTAFSYDEDGQICQCGKIVPILVGPFEAEQIHIGIECKAAKIPGIPIYYLITLQALRSTYYVSPAGKAGRPAERDRNKGVIIIRIDVVDAQ